MGVIDNLLRFVTKALPAELDKLGAEFSFDYEVKFIYNRDKHVEFTGKSELADRVKNAILTSVKRKYLVDAHIIKDGHVMVMPYTNPESVTEVWYDVYSEGEKTHAKIEIYSHLLAKRNSEFIDGKIVRHIDYDMILNTLIHLACSYDCMLDEITDSRESVNIRIVDKETFDSFNFEAVKDSIRVDLIDKVSRFVRNNTIVRYRHDNCIQAESKENNQLHIVVDGKAEVKVAFEEKEHSLNIYVYSEHYALDALQNIYRDKVDGMGARRKRYRKVMGIENDD